VIIVVSVLVFIGNVVVSMRRSIPAGDNPWDAPSLEWATQSPPASYVFLPVPVVASRHPLWPAADTRAVATGLRTDIREVLMTTLMDAIPDSRQDSKAPSIWPFIAAIVTGVMFITAIFTAWGIAIGSVLIFPVLVAWAWPRRNEQRKRLSSEIDPLSRAGA